MDRTFDHRDAMAILSLLGFSNIPEGRDGQIRFSLFGEDFEVMRCDEQICIGIMLPVESAYDFYGYNLAMEEMAGEEPRLQGFYSSEDVFKMRIWLPCSEENELGPAISVGMRRLLSIRERFGEKMLGCVYDEFRPIFDDALSGKGKDSDGN